MCVLVFTLFSIKKKGSGSRVPGCTVKYREDLYGTAYCEDWEDTDIPTTQEEADLPDFSDGWGTTDFVTKKHWSM